MKQDTTPYSSLIDAYLNGTRSISEYPEFSQAMLDESFRAILDERMQSDFDTWESVDLAPITPPTERVYQNLIAIIARRKRQSIFAKVAAVLIPFLLIIGGYSLWTITKDSTTEMNHLYVARGEMVQLCLQDGTRVWVNSDTKVDYPKDFNRKKRSVRLEGEAYFKVAPDQNKPFDIEVNGLMVKVVGTSFNVRAYPENECVTIALDEGKVLVYSMGSSEEKGISLLPGDVLSYQTTNRSYRKSSSQKVALYSDWRSHKLLFKETPLLEVLQTLERRFDLRFELKDQELKRLTYTMTCVDDEPENIFKRLMLISPIDIKTEGDVWVIRKQR